MGLLLLIPGLIFLLNGTDWFSGEDQVGLILAIIGGVLLALQVLWFSKVRKMQRQVFDRHARLAERDVWHTPPPRRVRR